MGFPGDCNTSAQTSSDLIQSSRRLNDLVYAIFLYSFSFLYLLCRVDSCSGTKIDICTKRRRLASNVGTSVSVTVNTEQTHDVWQTKNRARALPNLEPKGEQLLLEVR